MAQRFFSPFQQFVDASGLPYSGGSLTFYASGTSTPQNTYADRALTIANPNPVVLNSRGVPSVAVFLQALQYKVVLADSSNNQIWTADPVSTDDFDAFPVLIVGNGSPTGVVAGTAASLGSPNVLPTSYWDAQNSLYYFCTRTGNAATAQWTNLNPAVSSPTPVVTPPQGYLTPSSGVPIIAGDSSGATSVFYTPYVGNLVPIYNSTLFTPTQFTELTLTLTGSAHSSNIIYDVFVFSNSGVLTLFTGPAWSSSTAGSCSRGSGAATTQLSRINGIWTNAVAIAAGVNGASTYSVGANLATYLGSLFIDSVAGQITCHRGYGQNRKWGIYNAYNRAPVYLKCGDSTATWNPPSVASYRQSNASANNTLTVFSGLTEDAYDIRFIQRISAASAGVTDFAFNAIGLNVTNAASGKAGSFGFPASSSTTGSDMVAEYLMPPSLGINNINALENPSAHGTMTYYGTEANMILSAIWRV